MSKRIVWQAPDGSLRITAPVEPPLPDESEQMYLDRVATNAKSTDPSLAVFTRLPDVDATDLPARTYREFWRHNGTAVTVDTVAAQATLLTRLRAKAAALIDQAQDTQAIKDRAILLVVLDELNALRQWVTDFKAATAAATSLVNLQTRVAATNNLPQRTAAQIRPAVRAKMTGGDADS